MKKEQYDVLIIGGGAAGMMAAISAGRAGASVLLLERNEKLGKKVYITGKGRCNVTNAAERDSFFKNIMRNPRFFFAAYSRFDNNALMDLIEQAGCPLKVERGDRVFPTSDKASDITRALEGEMRRCGAEVRLQARVEKLLTEEGRAAGVQLENGEQIRSGSVILATGGLSYPTTGSTGDGHRLAKETGHGLTACLPSLVPINTVETWPSTLSGLTLKNVRLSAKGQDGKQIYSDQGEMMFTHFGVTGPLVLSLSAVMPEDARGVRLEIDLKPALTHKALDDRLLRDIQANPRASLASIVYGLAPRALGQEILRIAGFSPETKASEWRSADRKALVSLLKALPLTAAGLRGYNEAVVTRGGVRVKDVNPSTMESRRLPGLFFAGELIDIDALTGGFNLQLAFSTGYLAGEKAAEKTQ
ncbi:MAG: NAD(P)/FAD-dependent oxidoreductase [Eubacteriales bacterium]|nr:NAD(P)/FAD-dependent oxidoreductase [Eubacteriales bacterium]